ncbi:MAG TPA: molybdenum cofactor guanylyltransferase [Actinomycetota bacterium]
MDRASSRRATDLASGVVLAGGRSSRFGSEDKLRAEVDGIPLLHHPIRRLDEVTGDVVVVLAPGGPEPPLPAGSGVRIARDVRESEGPLAGALAGLGIVDRELAVVVGGDMPGLSSAVLRAMVGVADETSADAVALQDGDRFRPLPAVVRVTRARTVGERLLRDGERSLRAWLRAMGPTVVEEPVWTALDPERVTLRDIDETSDLDRT